MSKVRREVFDHPFYGDAISFCKAQGEPSEELNISEEPNGLPQISINGFIFHTSHCGSTLLSRMLAQLPGVRVVSETEAINGLLLSQWMHQLPEEQVLPHLKAIIESYRQPFGDDQFLIFKTTSWNIFHIELFQKLYPQVPWIYIDRDTEKAVESSIRDGGGFVQWWDYPTDLPRKYLLYPGQSPKNKKDYVWQVMENQRAEASKAKNENFMFLRYPDFLESFTPRILPHFELEFTQEEIEKAKSMIHFESKSYEMIGFKKVNKK